MNGSLKVGFLVCPPESLLDGFVHRPADLDPSLVRAVSSHLARCAACREEADRRRRGLEAVRSREPWFWALGALAVLAACGAVFLWHEPARPSAESAARFTTAYMGRETAARPDPRIASLARFDPPREAALSLSMFPALSLEDERELSAARSRLGAGSSADAARLLEDLTARNPSRGPLVLLLAYAYARSEEFEKAQWQYAQADGLGAGVEACLGLANASLKVGDIATARRELADHVLSRRPDDQRARDLLDRIEASSQRLPR